MNRRVTLRDVAEQGGVAVSTVSLALNRDRQIPDKTQERIAKLAREMGYTIPAAALIINREEYLWCSGWKMLDEDKARMAAEILFQLIKQGAQKKGIPKTVHQIYPQWNPGQTLPPRAY